MASIVFGLVAIALGLWGLSAWWWSVAEVLRGIVPLLLILIGPVALGAGITKIRENSEMEAVLASEARHDEGGLYAGAEAGVDTGEGVGVPTGMDADAGVSTDTDTDAGVPTGMDTGGDALKHP